MYIQCLASRLAIALGHITTTAPKNQNATSKMYVVNVFIRHNVEKIYTTKKSA